MSRTPRILRQPNPNFRRSGRPEAGPQQRVVIDPGRSAIAGKYFLSDVPGATVPASRLSTVLENIEQDKKLSANAFEYLRQQGYLALLSLASGESNYQEFSNLARVEQGKVYVLHVFVLARQISASRRVFVMRFAPFTRQRHHITYLF